MVSSSVVPWLFVSSWSTFTYFYGDSYACLPSCEKGLSRACCIPAPSQHSSSSHGEVSAGAGNTPPSWFSNLGHSVHSCHGTQYSFGLECSSALSLMRRMSTPLPQPHLCQPLRAPCPEAVPLSPPREFHRHFAHSMGMLCSLWTPGKPEQYLSE